MNAFVNIEAILSCGRKRGQSPFLAFLGPLFSSFLLCGRSQGNGCRPAAQPGQVRYGRIIEYSLFYVTFLGNELAVTCLVSAGKPHDLCSKVMTRW